MIRCGLYRLAVSQCRSVHSAIIGNTEISQSSTNDTFTSVNPATNEPVGEVVNCGKVEAEAAVAAALQCFRTFKNSGVAERGRLLTAWAYAIQNNAEVIAELVTKEMGKPKHEALGEVLYATSFLYHYAGQVNTATTGSVINKAQPHWRPITVRQPVGVVATITAWNFPVAMIIRKVGAVIAAGCSVINSPSEDTPLTSLYLAKLGIDVGFPPGLFNVVASSRDQKQPIGELLCGSTDVSALSFTGSTAVGKLLYRQCSDTIKRVHLELGGNAPFIVFPSADMDRAVKGAMAAKFHNCGQSCSAANRFFVHSSLYNEFIEKLAKEMSKLNQGHGLMEGVNLGPLVNIRAYEKVSATVSNSKAFSEPVSSASLNKNPVPYFDPTILAFGDKTDVPIFEEEIFGPIAAVWKFENEDEVVRLANSTRHGLVAYIFTRDMRQSWSVSEELEFGMIAVNEGTIRNPNHPSGGWKESGIGREGGPGGIDEFTEEKLTCFGL